jgi:hypothetical protein
VRCRPLLRRAAGTHTPKRSAKRFRVTAMESKPGVATNREFTLSIPKEALVRVSKRETGCSSFTRGFGGTQARVTALAVPTPKEGLSQEQQAILRARKDLTDLRKSVDKSTLRVHDLCHRAALSTLRHRSQVQKRIVKVRASMDVRADLAHRPSDREYPSRHYTSFDTSMWKHDEFRQWFEKNAPSPSPAESDSGSRLE